MSINIFDLNFYQAQMKWKHNLIPTEISKNDESDRVAELLIYKSHHALIKKLNVFLGDHHKNFICRRCLNSYTSENAFLIHKKKCGIGNMCTIRTSSESHIQWNKRFHEKHFYFRIFADFETDNEIDNSSIGNKTTDTYEQLPVLTGYEIVSELEDVLKIGYYESPLDYKYVNWFVNEVIKLEKKMVSHFKNTKKDIIMTQQEKQDFDNNKICRFCEKEIIYDKVRDHCHWTGKI